ncbi:LCP family protein [Thermosipho ferrireducens]|uniref:LCP family protein n=1 Tax=Thermosipho ferrireducens TaxID=2571116 RepID=A0ABX7S7X0_9BACT|nr:LCP family protein [Thermosipho ferrireducens]QTA37900.1 LCP family protein [Thermosipho ferrireducens]
MKMKTFFLTVSIVICLAMLIFIPLPWLKILYSMFYSPIPGRTNFLVLGLDRNIQGTRRTDVIIFASIDTSSRKVILSNIPRDLIYNDHKINSIFQNEGLDKLSQIIKELTGQNIEKYIILDYSVIKLVGDTIGPIEVYVNEPMKYTDYSQNLFINFEPGYHKLNGSELLAFIRYRKDANGDIARIERQKYVINKLIETAFKKDIFTLSHLYKSVFKQIETNLKTGELVYFAAQFRKGLSILSINFPIKYDKKGNIYAGNLKNFKKEISIEKQLIKTKKYNFYVLNNTSNQSRTYNVNLYYMWKAANFPPENVYNLKNLKIASDTVFLLNNNLNPEEIKNIAQVVHPKRKFLVKHAEESLENYYRIIDALSSERTYLRFPIDFIVVLSQ